MEKKRLTGKDKR